MALPSSADPHRTRTRLTRRSVVNPASIFIPYSPLETPETHFPLQTVFRRSPFPRMVNRYNSKEILLVIDGSCLNNGSKDPALAPIGGCSFIYKTGVPSPTDLETGTVSTGLTSGTVKTGTTLPFVGGGDGITGKVGFRLENQGPDGHVASHTSNRTKLRAAIAALDFRAWDGEGWQRIVLATDLEYLVYGATQWLPMWVHRRWRNRKGRKVANRDLWEELQGRIEDLREYGTEVSFWLVPSQRGESGVRDHPGWAMMREAKEAAREAALIEPEKTTEEFTKLCGLMV